MDEYDVDPDERALLPDGLGGDLADMRDELQLQVVRLATTVARAVLTSACARLSRWNRMYSV
jgi:hypothetical protein